MSHVQGYVEKGNDVVPLSQFVSALNYNGGLGNTKPIFHTANCEWQTQFGGNHSVALQHSGKSYSRSNELQFNDERGTVKHFKYSSLSDVSLT